MIDQVAQHLRRRASLAALSARRAEGGQGIVEYALITSLIAVAVLVVATVGGVGTALINLYNAFPGAF